MDSIIKEAESMAAGVDLDTLDITADELTEEPSAGARINFSWIKTKTGPGAVDDYIEHPLNFNESRGVAQILRGASGLVGSLDLAVIDIVIGTFNAARERKAAKSEKTAFYGE